MRERKWRRKIDEKKKWKKKLINKLFLNNLFHLLSSIM